MICNASLWRGVQDAKKQVLNGKATFLAVPKYPAKAKLVRGEYLVAVEVSIGDRGQVVSAHAYSGPDPLRGAAEEATMKCRFPKKMSGLEGILLFKFVSQ